MIASQRTMSRQNWVLSGQILGLPDMSSNYLLVQRNFNSLLFDKKEGQHLCFRKKNKMKLDKLAVDKFPVVTNFHDVINSCRNANYRVFRYFVYFKCSQLVEGFTFG